MRVPVSNASTGKGLNASTRRATHRKLNKLRKQGGSSAVVRGASRSLPTRAGGGATRVCAGANI